MGKEVRAINKILKKFSNKGVFFIITLIMMLFIILNNFTDIFYSDFIKNTEKKADRISYALDEIRQGVTECNNFVGLMCENDLFNIDGSSQYIEIMQNNYINRFNKEKSYYCVNCFFYNINYENKSITGAFDIKNGKCSIYDIADDDDLKKIYSEKGWNETKSTVTGNKYLIYSEPVEYVYNSEKVNGYIGAAVEYSYIRNIMLDDGSNDFVQNILINRKSKKAIAGENIYGNNESGVWGFDYDETDMIIAKRIYIRGFDVYGVNPVNNEITFVQKGNSLLLREKSNIMIIISYLFIMMMYLILDISKKFKQFNVFVLIDAVAAKIKWGKYNKYSLKTKSFAAAFLAVVSVFAINLAYAVISGENYTYIISVFVYLVLWIAALYLYDFGNIKLKYKRLIIASAYTVMLVLFLLCECLWNNIYGLFMSILLFTGGCLYNLRKRDFSDIFAFIVTSTVCMFLMNVIIRRKFIDELSIMGIALTFIFIFMMYVMNMLLIRNNDIKAKEKTAILHKLKDTQEIIIANEKMTALGKIVASVAHEINTPIGAIKASADSCSTNLVPFLENFSSKVMALGDDERKNVFELIELSGESVKRLLSTSEIRSAKRKIKVYLEENGIENAFEISNKIARIEICDIEDIKKRIDIFKKENINDILNIVCDVFFLVTGLNTTVVGTNKISKIVYALKSYSNLSSFSIDGNIEEFNIIECIDNIITLYSNQFTDKISIVKSYDNVVEKIIGNSEGIGQVCLNIIQNALYAMKESGGVLTITTKKVNDMIYLEFADTGCGIAPENINKVFEPLFTTKPLGEGSGLGLGICKRIVEGHKGTISVTSILNEGTSFFITLPVNQKLNIQKED